MANNNTMHSYYPPRVIIHGYVENTLSTPQILALFVSTLTSILLPCSMLIRRLRPAISTSQLSTALWFILCGVIHLGLEGSHHLFQSCLPYIPIPRTFPTWLDQKLILHSFLTSVGHYVRNEHRIAASSHPLAQAWKEYALSDSRYLTRDSFLVCMEAITALLWGPLSLLCAYGVVVQYNNRSAAPWRHPLQIIISVGQIYGDVLYYGTCTYEAVVYGNMFSRPEMYYFIGYYVFLNAVWIVIPGILLISSVRATMDAVVRAGTERLDSDARKRLKAH